MIVAYINGERTTFNSDNDSDYGYGKEITTDDGTFVIFGDAELAGESAREYWEDLAKNDPEEFACIVGEETLIAWALGQWAGPGTSQVRSLNEWLDLWLDTPEEHFATWDGEEREFHSLHPDYRDYTVAYRTN